MTVFCRHFPIRGFTAANVFGVVFIREDRRQYVCPRLMNHEAIHTAQMRELLWVGFYVLYALEWTLRLGNYRAVSFEREAYSMEQDPDYLPRRRSFAMWRT